MCRLNYYLQNVSHGTASKLETAKSTEHVLEDDDDFRHPVKEENNPHHDHDISAYFHDFRTVSANPLHAADKERKNEEWNRKS